MMIDRKFEQLYEDGGLSRLTHIHDEDICLERIDGYIEYLANNWNILDTSSYDLLQALYDVKVDCNLSFAYLDKTIQQHLLEYNDFCKNRTIEEKANKITLSKILSSGGKIMSTIKIPHQIIKLFQNSKDHIL